jgi:hypothetical protein
VFYARLFTIAYNRNVDQLWMLAVDDAYLSICLAQLNMASDTQCRPGLPTSSRHMQNDTPCVSIVRVK